MLSTELIDARNDNTVWADSYDRDLTDIFAIQSEVAQTIANKLTATLSPEEKKSIDAKPTGNLEAYDLYLRARELFVSARISFTDATVETPLNDAIGFLEQAVRLDPMFTLAYCPARLTEQRRREPARSVHGSPAGQLGKGNPGVQRCNRARST